MLLLGFLSSLWILAVNALSVAICYLSLHFIDSFLCSTEDSYLDLIPLVYFFCFLAFASRVFSNVFAFQGVLPIAMTRSFSYSNVMLLGHRSSPLHHSGLFL